MMRAFSLAYLTYAPFGPVEAIELAARIGYAHVGLRIAPAMPGGAFAPLIENKALLAETVACLKANGVTVLDVEIVRMNETFALEQVKPFLDVCSQLSARAVLVAGDDPDEPRLIANYATFCDAAASHGLTADLEFMPWTAVKDCRTARSMIEKAARPNGRILVDALHAARSTTRLAELAALPKGMLSYAQICDAAKEIPANVEGLIHTARCARLLPGEGGIDLHAMFAALPGDIPISIEIPNDVMKAAMGVEAWSGAALARARQVLSAL